MMRIGQLLSAISGKTVRDSWVYGRCPNCDTVSNLGSAPSTTKAETVSYLCGSCRAVIVEARPDETGKYAIDVRGGMWVEVPGRGRSEAF